MNKEENNKEWVDIKDKAISITRRQQFNGKTFKEIKEIIKNIDYRIADYELLQELRNIYFEGEEKFSFLEDFWVFVPNPDKISKDNDYIAGFVAGSVGAFLDCDRLPSNSISSLGVFLIKDLEKEE